MQERDELRLAVRASEALTAAAERRLSEAEVDNAAIRARVTDVEREVQEAEAAKAVAAAEVARLTAALQVRVSLPRTRCDACRMQRPQARTALQGAAIRLRAIWCGGRLMWPLGFAGGWVLCGKCMGGAA